MQWNSSGFPSGAAQEKRPQCAQRSPCFCISSARALRAHRFCLAPIEVRCFNGASSHYLHQFCALPFRAKHLVQAHFHLRTSRKLALHVPYLDVQRRIRPSPADKRHTHRTAAQLGGEACAFSGRTRAAIGISRSGLAEIQSMQPGARPFGLSIRGRISCSYTCPPLSASLPRSRRIWTSTCNASPAAFVMAVLSHRACPSS